MSMFSDIAIEGQMKKLLDLAEANKQKPATEQLAELISLIKEIHEASKSGYL